MKRAMPCCGANPSAMAYSLAETAKENQLNPFTYLKYLFEQLPNLDVEDRDVLDSLLPWSDRLPDDVRHPVASTDHSIDSARRERQVGAI